jgi:hypothetical protein
MSDWSKQPPIVRFASILDGALKAIARHTAIPADVRRLLLLVYSWINRTKKRFAALAARVAAGKASPRPRPASVTPRSKGEAPEKPDKPRPPSLPREKAWLLVLMKWEIACYRSTIMNWLEEPEVVALIQAAPQAGRLLRPLCRLLGIDLPPILKLPPRPRRPKPPKPEPTPEAAAEARLQRWLRRRRRADGPPKRPGPPIPGMVWRKWRDIWMPEKERPPD